MCCLCQLYSIGLEMYLILYCWFCLLIFLGIVLGIVFCFDFGIAFGIAFAGVF